MNWRHEPLAARVMGRTRHTLLGISNCAIKAPSPGYILFAVDYSLLLEGVDSFTAYGVKRVLKDLIYTEIYPKRYPMGVVG